MVQPGALVDARAPATAIAVATLDVDKQAVC